MSNLNDLLNVAPEPMVIDGKTYQLSQFTIEIRCRFEAWVKESLFKELDRVKPYLTEKVYGEQLSNLIDRIGAGCCDFYGKVSQIALQTTHGLAYLLFLLLGDKVPEDECNRLVIQDTKTVGEHLKTILGNAHPQDRANPAPLGKN